jgi:hypothetical protein
MFKDRRKFRRQSNGHGISRRAKIQLAGGSLPRDCLLTNMSDGGVRLHVEGVDVPDRFVLLLSDDRGIARLRDCSVVWRLGYELSAEFADTSGRGNAARTYESVDS